MARVASPCALARRVWSPHALEVEDVVYFWGRRFGRGVGI